LDDHGQLDHAEAAAAVLLRQGDRRQARFADRVPNFAGKRLAGIEIAPVIEAEALAHFRGRVDDQLLFVTLQKIHQSAYGCSVRKRANGVSSACTTAPRNRAAPTPSK